MHVNTSHMPEMEEFMQVIDKKTNMVKILRLNVKINQYNLKAS